MSHGGCDYGLEDKMLRKNIAGRYSTWEKDSDEEGPSSRTEWRKESNESHFSKKCTVDRASLSPPRHAVNGRGRAGPKGVLEDYREHLEVNAMAIAAEAEERRTEILLHCYGTTGSPKFLADVHDFAGDSEDDDEEDRAACERYRAQRQVRIISILCLVPSKERQRASPNRAMFVCKCRQNSSQRRCFPSLVR